MLKLGTRPGGATETLLGFGLPAELTLDDNNVLSASLTVFNDYSYACPSSTMPAVQVAGQRRAVGCRQCDVEQRAAGRRDGELCAVRLWLLDGLPAELRHH